MQIPRPSDADRDFFAAVVPDDPRVTIKPMFGNVAAFVNGNMFIGLFGSALGLRLAPSDSEALLAVEGACPFGPAERPMGGYVAVPDAWRDDRATLDEWIARALEYTASLPPKAPKTAKTR